MADVVREILLCLLLAALLGLAIGWLARGLRARRVASEEAADFRRALEKVQAELRILGLAHAEAQRSLAGLQTAAVAGRDEAETLRKQLRDTEAERDAARQDTEGAQQRLSHLSQQVKDAEAARDTARVEAQGLSTALAEAESRGKEALGARDVHLVEVERLRAAQASASTPEATRQRLDTLRATLQAAESGWDAARAQAESALQQLSATRRQLADSEVDRQALAARLADAQSLLGEFRSKFDVPSPVPSPRRDDEVPVTAGPPSTATKAGAKNARDDLQKIRGIGPVLERTLHRHGVYSYAQIATWTPEDILAMSERLPGFHGRIMRDQWTTVARRLHIAKYGSPP